MSDAAPAYESVSRLSSRIATGSTSSVKVAEELLARIDALDEKLHAFIRIMPEQALAQARAAEQARKDGEIGRAHV